MASLLLRILESPSLEPVTLLAAEKKARAYTSAQAQQLRELKRAATVRARAALDLRDETRVTAALAIWREVIGLGIRAVQVAQNKQSEAGQNLLSELEQLRDDGSLGEPDLDYSKLEILLATLDPLELDRLPRATQLALRDTAEAAQHWLLGSVEARTPRQILLARIAQPLLAALGIAFLVWVTILVFARPTGVDP